MSNRIAENLAQLMRHAQDDQSRAWTLEVAIAAAAEGGYEQEISGILQEAFMMLAENAEASEDEMTRVLIVSSLKAVEAELASRASAELAGGLPA